MFTVIAMRTASSVDHTIVRAMSISLDEPSNRYDPRSRGAGEAAGKERELQLLTMNKDAHNENHTDSRYPTVDIDGVEKSAKNARSNNYRELFPNTTSRFVAGMKFIPREAFLNKFNVGYGVDKGSVGNEEVMLLYQSEGALPSTSKAGDPDEDLDAALENCNRVHVVMVEPKPGPRGSNAEALKHKQCIAIVGQWESRHVHRFQREKNKREYTDSFKYLQHHHLDSPPSNKDREASQQALLSYLTVVDDALVRLKPIAEKASLGSDNKPGPIIVMVANAGQMSFFANFVCSARHRHLDISRVLLFATDRYAYELATATGVQVFFDESIFGSMPVQAAKDYKDDVYGRIMMSKVYCVHMVNALGYDLLFQDLDLVWYQNPLDYFGTQVDPSYDMYFQHDGDHHPVRFKPLAANTGVYFVRHNARTEYFFSVFVRMGELVLADKSHQAALTTLANEHMSLWGLRVKVLQEDNLLFLSGYHKNTFSRSLRKTINGEFLPILYHVNWMDGHMKKPALIESNNWFFDDRSPFNQTSTVPSGEQFFARYCLPAPFRETS